MALVNTITRPINDFAVARLFGARSALSYVENAVARSRSEEGGIGMQAAIIAGVLVAAAIGVALVIRNRGADAIDALQSAAAATQAAALPTAAIPA